VKAAKDLDVLLEQTGIGARSEAGLRVKGYVALLEKWNARIDLTASTRWEALGALMHEALWAAGLYPNGAVSHLDIGSGAGFPALVMRLVLPQIQALGLVEPRLKRAVFLETVARELGLEGVWIQNSTIEDLLKSSGVREWQIISWKAVKLRKRTLEDLQARGGRSAQYWIFHGAELPISRREEGCESLTLVRRESFPGRDGWYLSIMTSVSRETLGHQRHGEQVPNRRRPSLS
jgi:16S rRNA (guanine(527)-N(7))-methyltransferase RsmG